MKKIASLIVCFSIVVFAQYEQYEYQLEDRYQYPLQQQYGVNMDQRDKIQKLIKAGLKKNKDEIQKESLYLSSTDRESLYEQNKKKSAAGWAALDFGVGFGLGSYIQGDVGFGIAQSIMDGVGWTFVIYASNINTEKEDCYYNGYHQTCEYENDEEAEIVQVVLIQSAIAILVTSRIMSWILPFSFQKKYNNMLKDALGNGNNVSYSIDPLILPRAGKPAIGLAFNMRY